ncbi:MAG: hypothetical protein IKW20_05370 [Bacteroidales bacterium]|nr:hypothetical protein [Bacteroidales bacterium]
MPKLIEQDLIRPFIGKAVNQEAFNKVAYKNGSEYMICNADYIDDPQYCELFGITDRLKWMWKYSGVDLTIYLAIDDGAITKARLYKAKEGCSGHGRSTSCVLTVSQQELRIVRRILQYITN